MIQDRDEMVAASMQQRESLDSENALQVNDDLLHIMTQMSPGDEEQPRCEAEAEREVILHTRTGEVSIPAHLGTVVQELRKKSGLLSQIEQEMEEMGVHREDVVVDRDHNERIGESVRCSRSPSISSSCSSASSSSSSLLSTSKLRSTDKYHKRQSSRSPTPDVPLRTKNEVSEDPDLPFPSLPTLSAEEPVALLGKIESIISTVMVISSASSATVLDEGSLVCWSDKTSIGYVFEIFGPTARPYYTVRLQSVPAENVVGRDVFFATNAGKFIIEAEVRKLGGKGTDASNLYDEEADEQEWSDDEKEREFKKSQKKGKKQVEDKDLYKPLDRSYSTLTPASNTERVTTFSGRGRSSRGRRGHNVGGRGRESFSHESSTYDINLSYPSHPLPQPYNPFHPQTTQQQYHPSSSFSLYGGPPMPVPYNSTIASNGWGNQAFGQGQSFMFGQQQGFNFNQQHQFGYPPWDGRTG